MFRRYEAAALSLLPVIGMASDGYGDRAIMVVMMVRWLIPRAGLCVCVVKYGSCWRYLAEIGYTWRYCLRTVFPICSKCIKSLVACQLLDLF